MTTTDTSIEPTVTTVTAVVTEYDVALDGVHATVRAEQRPGGPLWQATVFTSDHGDYLSGYRDTADGAIRLAGALVEAGRRIRDLQAEMDRVNAQAAKLARDGEPDHANQPPF